jgi:hypothetical protein
MFASVVDPSEPRVVSIAITLEGRPIFSEHYVVSGHADMGRAVFHAHSSAVRLCADIDPARLKTDIQRAPRLQ